MKAGSMEGLIGADVNLKMSQTPMRVYREAERRGDTEAMKRAMGYVTDFQEKAYEYSDRSQEELAGELKEEREEQEARLEQARERREEAKEYAEKTQESNAPIEPQTDRVEISKEGEAALKNNTGTEGSFSIVKNTDVKMYTGEGIPIAGKRGYPLQGE